ncbi:MAG: hypothetical protein H6732_12990 [Alphaproteobacteria bacterium]|nr:hypothetical protein [Alphaproteobacteria bacterium]
MRTWIGVGVLGLVTSGCGLVTAREAREAVVEAARSSGYQRVTDTPIELTTTVTLGDRVEAATEALADWWRSQAACAEVTVEGAAVRVDHGVLDDGCTWQGRGWQGVHTLTLTDLGPPIALEHRWEGFGDDLTTVDGIARVRWDLDALERQVITDLDWATDDRTTAVTGEHAYRLLDPDLGLLGGVVLDGSRSWEVAQAPWDLQMEGIELRWVDPAPQAGTFTVTTPRGAEVGITFRRVGPATIRATVDGTRRSWSFDVTLVGVELVEG